MADTKLADLTSGAPAAATDIIYAVKDPGGTPSDAKLTLGEVKTLVNTPGGSDTQIQFNDAGAFGGDADLTWDKTNNVLTLGTDVLIRRRNTRVFQLGAADAATALAQTIATQSVAAGNSNVAGANLTITGSQGTGTGAGGSIVFQVAPAVSSGTAQNALVTFLEATSARAFNLYNTTDVTTNYERGKIAWSSNVLQIGTEKAGTGTARALELQTDGTTRLTIGATTGNATFTGDVTVSSTKTLGFGSFANGTWSTSSLVLGTNTNLVLGGANTDTQLHRDDPGIFAMRRGTQTVHALRIYRTQTDASNYQRLALQTSATEVIVAAETAGTGADDIDVTLTPAGTGNVRFGTHTGTADTAVSGYIEIKDSGGTIRKLAVIS